MISNKTNKQVRAKVDVMNHQLKFIKSEAPFPGLFGGMGSGKTDALVHRTFNLIHKYSPMFKKEGKMYVFGLYEPTYALINKILIPRIELFCQKFNIEYDLNKSENKIYLRELGAIIYLVTMENPEKIIGYETADAIIDELDTLTMDKAEEVWARVLSRNRLKKPDGNPNTCGVTTTPEGFKFCYKKWVLEKNDKYEVIRGLTMNNKYISQDYIQSLIDSYPPLKLKAYLSGEFVNFQGLTVYEDFNKDLNVTTLEISDHDVLHIGMDFNVGKMSAVIGIIKDGCAFVLDEIFGVLDTPAMIKEIKKRYKNEKIYVYPDASGGQRKSVSASETDITLLKEHFIVKAKAVNPRVKDRVMTVQGMIKNGKGVRRLFINISKCERLVENLEQQIYDKNGEPDKRAGKDHMLDALGYFIYWHFAISKKSYKVIEYLY